MDQPTKTVPEGLLAKPLEFIQQDFQKFLGNENSTKHGQIGEKVEAYLKSGELAKMLEAGQDTLLTAQEIPLLNDIKTYKDLHDLNGKLVRYVGQTVDAENPELYLTTMAQEKTGELFLTKYREFLPENSKLK